MSKAELLALAERVEALATYCGKTQKEVFRAFYPDRVPALIVESGYGWREDDYGWWLATGEDARTPPKTIYPPNWLSSLDAGRALLPVHANTNINIGPSGIHAVKITFPGGDAVGIAKTPEFALTAAALRARAEVLP